MRPTLLYDGDCRLCRFAARAAVRLDSERRLAVLPFADDEAAPLLDRVPPTERQASWQLLLPDGRRVSRGHGLPELLRASGRGVRAATLLERLPLDVAYRLLARNRGRLGRLVPDGPAPRRS